MVELVVWHIVTRYTELFSLCRSMEWLKLNITGTVVSIFNVSLY